MAQMTKNALIISHGQPSDPEPAEVALAALAANVAEYLPGWRVLSATLAKPGALDAALANQKPGLIYPMFMAGGWFPMVEVPRRVEDVGGTGWAFLPPFGLDPSVQALGVKLAAEAVARLGRLPGDTDVLLAAHGSFRSAAPAEVANGFAWKLAGAGFARAEAYFIDQEPRIATARGFGPDAICLPFFAAEGGHVVDDLPAALAEAGFGGVVLPPLGLDPRVPELIAQALRAGAAAKA